MLSATTRGLLAAAVLTLAGCSVDPVSLTPARDGDPAARDTAQKTASIAIGASARGRITSADSTCNYTIGSEGWGGLCHAYLVTAEAGGILKVQVTWTADVPLVLFVKTRSGGQIDMVCCSSAIEGTIPVDSGVTYRLEVAYAGRPPGYPRIAPTDYELRTGMQQAGSATGSLQFRVFGDQQLTQQLSHARLEVVAGPAAGAVAVFDDETGIYEFTPLPQGHVLVRATADRHVSATVRVPVGLTQPREVTLQRAAPLTGPLGSLGGVTWAHADRKSAWTGVKIEIVDGPLAGVFTFTDDGFGMYALAGVPFGPVRLRATSTRTKPQELNAVIAASTVLHFYLEAK